MLGGGKLARLPVSSPANAKPKLGSETTPSVSPRPDRQIENHILSDAADATLIATL